MGRLRISWEICGVSCDGGGRGGWGLSKQSIVWCQLGPSGIITSQAAARRGADTHRWTERE